MPPLVIPWRLGALRHLDCPIWLQQQPQKINEFQWKMLWQFLWFSIDEDGACSPTLFPITSSIYKEEDTRSRRQLEPSMDFKHAAAVGMERWCHWITCWTSNWTSYHYRAPKIRTNTSLEIGDQCGSIVPLDVGSRHVWTQIQGGEFAVAIVLFWWSL